MFEHGDLPTILIGFSCILFLVTLVRHYAQGLVFSPGVWLMLIGIVYGIGHRKGWHDLPAIELHPEHVIMLALPLLIFASGRLIQPSSLKKDGLPIGLLAGPSVIATLFLIGLPIAWMLNISPLAGLLFAAPLAATDPIAVASVFKKFKVPKRLHTMIEGESLFNDGTAVVAFTAISGLVFGAGVFNLPSTTGHLVWSIIGALSLGASVGWITGYVLKNWAEESAFSEITITLMLTLGLFSFAEHVLHVSGVIAVVMAATFFIHARYKNRKTKSRESFDAFWNYLDALITGILPLTLGSAVGMHEFPVEGLILVPIVIALILIVRVVVIYATGLGLSFTKKKISFAWQNIFIWGGVRGGISAALVQTIPMDYPHRNVFLCLAFAVIFFTLVINPLVMRIYLKKAKL